MSRRIHRTAALVFVCLAGLHPIAGVASEDARKLTDNANSLIKEYQGKLKFSCSSFRPERPSVWIDRTRSVGPPITFAMAAVRQIRAKGTRR